MTKETPTATTDTPAAASGAPFAGATATPTKSKSWSQRPPLSQDQINRISLIFSSTAKDIDWTAFAAEGVMADVIQQHGLVRYLVECACGENFCRPQDWGRHVAEAIYETLEAAGVKRKRRTAQR